MKKSRIRKWFAEAKHWLFSRIGTSWTWISENKQWLFSGIGVFAIALGISRGPNLCTSGKPVPRLDGNGNKQANRSGKGLLPTMIVRYTEPSLAEIATKVAEEFRNNGRAQVRTDGPNPNNSRPSACNFEIEFAPKDATRKELIDQFWSVINAKWGKVSTRNPAKETLQVDFEVVVSCRE